MSQATSYESWIQTRISHCQYENCIEMSWRLYTGPKSYHCRFFSPQTSQSLRIFLSSPLHVRCSSNDGGFLGARWGSGAGSDLTANYNHRPPCPLTFRSPKAKLSQRPSPKHKYRQRVCPAMPFSDFVSTPSCFPYPHLENFQSRIANNTLSAFSTSIPTQLSIAGERPQT